MLSYTAARLYIKTVLSFSYLYNTHFGLLAKTSIWCGFNDDIVKNIHYLKYFSVLIIFTDEFCFLTKAKQLLFVRLKKKVSLD